MLATNFSMELLETFLVVAEAGNVSKAAQILHRSQPAISERLQRLTEFVGEPLYYPVGRGIRLTAAGEAYLAPAKRLRELQNELADMRKRRTQLQQGQLRIAATNTVANYFLPRYLVQFRQQYPQVELFLKGGISDWSQYSLLDWDLFFLEDRHPDIEIPKHYQLVPWLQDEILTIFPPEHPLATQQELDFADLLAYPIVWREPQSGIRRLVLQEFRARHLEPTIRIEVSSVEAMGTAVAAGLGIGFITQRALQHRPDWQLHGRRIPKSQGIHWTLYLVAPQPPYQSHILARFLESIGLPDRNFSSQETGAAMTSHGN